MSALPYHLVNSFSTGSPTSGSQCAVVLLPPSDDRLENSTLLQDIAHNFNFPATAFVRPTEGIEKEYDIRWFASGELPFCGHGTLAAVHTLFSLHPNEHKLTFNAQPGKLVAERDGSGVKMSIPVIPIDESTPDTTTLLASISQVSNITKEDVVDLVTFTWSGLGVIVELDREFDLREAKIDGGDLANTSARMVIFTQMLGQEEGALRIASRVFLPDAANVEDPATGSAHAALTAYYSLHRSPLSRLPAEIIKDGFDIVAEQLSARGGAMRIRYEDGRAMITAEATEWGRGTLAGR